MHFEKEMENRESEDLTLPALNNVSLIWLEFDSNSTKQKADQSKKLKSQE